MNQIVNKKKPETVVDFLSNDDFKNKMKKVLPSYLTPDRMASVSLSCIRKSPQLAACNPLSFINAIMRCAMLGLEPGDHLGLVHLIPYGKEVQVQIGYQGLIELVLRTGKVLSIVAKEVYENDEFYVSYGTEEQLVHRPCLKDRGACIGVYAYAKLVGGTIQSEILTMEEVDAIMRTSKTFRNGPWQTHPSAMRRKTAIKQLCKYLPKTADIIAAIEVDDSTTEDKITIDQGVESLWSDDVPEEKATSKSDEMIEMLES
jgi:recombination protein RecT